MKLFVSIACLLVAVPAFAQGPVLEWESDEGLGLAFSEAMPDDRFDLDGDGRRDLPLIEENAEGAPERMVVYDVSTGAVLGVITYSDFLPLGGNEQFPKLRGYLDVDGDGAKEAVFRGEHTLSIIGILVAAKRAAELFVVPARRFAAADVDRDGEVELIVGNPETRTVQVYGSGATGTAAEADIAASVARLAQNFPNPFRQVTTIAYEMERPGSVRLEIYDLRGRLVRTLVDEARAAGAHRAVWDGTDASGRAVASGTYVYRLRAGEAVTSRRVVRVR